MYKAKIIITGKKIHEIGYRDIPDDAILENLKIEDFTGNVMDIDRYLHLIQVEQLNKGIPAILDFREMFMHEVSELRGEIADIKATLARMHAAG